MLTEVQELFLALAALHCVESVWRMPEASVLVCETRMLRPGDAFRAGRSLLAFINPLPPFRRVFQAQMTPPLSISPDGIVHLPPFALDAPSWVSCDPATALFANIKEGSVFDDNRLLIDGRHFAWLHDSMAAKETASLINELSAMDANGREAKLQRMFKESMDMKLWQGRMEECIEATYMLPALCTLQFMLIFVLAPVSVKLYGFSLRTAPPLAMLALNTMSIVALHWIAHRRLVKGRILERLWHSFIMLVCPSIATRAAMLLSRKALDGCHPCLAAFLAMPEGKARRELEDIARDIANPLPKELSKHQRDILDWQRAMLSKKLGNLLKELGSSTEDALKSPERCEGCLSYCPRCQVQYTVAEGVCTDCGGIPLSPFPKEIAKR